MLEYDRALNLVQDIMEEKKISKYDLVWLHTFLENIKQDYLLSKRSYQENQLKEFTQ